MDGRITDTFLSILFSKFYSGNIYCFYNKKKKRYYLEVEEVSIAGALTSEVSSARLEGRDG